MPCRFSRNLDFRNHGGAASLRLNFEVAVELPETFSHTTKADAGSARFEQVSLLLLGYSLTFIPNLNRQEVILPIHSDGGSGTSRVAMDIGQTLLNDPEDCNFNVVGQPAEIRWNIEIDFYFAALGESVYIPTQRRHQPGYVKQGRMQQVRDGTNLSGDLFHQHGVLGHGPCSVRIELTRLLLNDRDIHADGGEQLAYAVMQFPRNALAFFILHSLKA